MMSTGGLDLRPLAPDELPAAWELGRLAFGGPPGDPPSTAVDPGRQLTRWGAFDPAGRLLGKAVDLHHEQWWGGRKLPAAGVAGVAVAPEARGRGLGSALVKAVLDGARRRGAVVSALFPTATAIYRPAGYEVVGALRWSTLPTALLDRRRVPGGLVVRAAEPADLPAVRDVYDGVAAAGNGLLSRRGGLFGDSADRLPDGLDGITVVTEAGQVMGYLSWARGRGYGHDAVLEVYDALALTSDTGRALLAVLGSWSSVTPTLRLRLLAGSGLSALLPVERLREHAVDVWMHRPVDVVGAVAGRGWPRWLRTEAHFHLEDPVAAGNAGSWRLEIADGEGHLQPASAQASLPKLSVRGFSQLYAGATRCAQLRAAGLLTGGDRAADDRLDALATGPPAELLDYF